jgi:hypothetical protein
VLSVTEKDRVLIAGMSQSGKSTLGTKIINAWDLVFVDDTKGDPNAIIPNAKVTGDWREVVKALPGRVVYQPSRADMVDHRKKVNAIIDRIFALGGHHGIALHELPDVADDQSERETPAIYEVFRKGAFSCIPIVAMTQRPVSIPKVARTESSVVFTFALMDPDDIRTMASIMGSRVRDEPLALPFDYSFYVRDQRAELTKISGGVH